MVIEELLKGRMEGLGNDGEVGVLGMEIFKVKEGVRYCEGDYEVGMKDFEGGV